MNDASSIIYEAADVDANIIFGAVVDPKMTGKMKITVIATGFNRFEGSGRRQTVTPVDIQNYKPPKEMGAGSEEFYRKGGENLAADLDFDTVETENGEDLDVPAFLEKREILVNYQRSTISYRLSVAAVGILLPSLPDRPPPLAELFPPRNLLDG